MADRSRWKGGIVSHEEMAEVDRKFWRDAGPAARFVATVELSRTMYGRNGVGRWGRDGSGGVRKMPDLAEARRLNLGDDGEPI